MQEIKTRQEVWMSRLVSPHIEILKPKNHNTIEFELGHANILDLMSLASVMNSGSNTL